MRDGCISFGRWIVVFLPLFWISAALAGSEVTVAPDFTAAGVAIPEDFNGLSFETRVLLPDADGKRLFSPDNQPLLAMFKQLGIKCLRLGGGSVESSRIKAISNDDIDSLYAFAKAADVSVIYTLKFYRQTDTHADADLAKYILDHYASQTLCVALGSEPDAYCKGYDDYRQQFQGLVDAIVATAPDAKFCGPSTSTGKSAWAADFAKDFAPGGHIKCISQHVYPGGDAADMTDAVAGRSKLLDPAMAQLYQNLYDSFAPAAAENNLPFRLDEANSAFRGGAKDVSNSFASALWGLDLMYWWAQHGAAGVNLHTSVRTTTDETTIPQGYDLFWQSPGGFKVHPLGYAVKAFDIGSHGKLIPLTLVSKDNLNLTAYAVASAENDLYFTVINKENGPEVRDAEVTLDAGSGRTRAIALFLNAPHSDVSASSDITLGDSAIGPDASWTGNWTNLPAGNDAGRFILRLPAGSAAVVRCTSGQ